MHHEAGEFKSVLIPERKKCFNQQPEKHSKNRLINIRISELDLQALQRRVLEEGMPYQTLVCKYPS